MLYLIIILGIDALDLDIVNRLGLHNVKQTVCRELVIPTECYADNVPFSPYCWETILTGKLPQINLDIYESRFENILLEFLRRKIGRYLGFIKGKRYFLEKIGFELNTPDKEKLSLRDTNTIFNLSENTNDFNLVHYSKGYVFNPFYNIKDNKIRSRKMLEFADKEFDLFKKWFKIVINQNYDLIMGYTRILDWYGHYIFDSDVYYNQYRFIDLFIKNLSAKLKGTIIIVSDHGMHAIPESDKGRVGDHTDKAFFSINKTQILEPNSLLDIYPLLEDLLIDGSR